MKGREGTGVVITSVGWVLFVKQWNHSVWQEGSCNQIRGWGVREKVKVER